MPLPNGIDNTTALQRRFVTDDNHTYLICSDGMGTRIYIDATLSNEDIPSLTMGCVYFVNADDVQRLRVIHRSGYIAVLQPYDEAVLGLCYHKTRAIHSWDTNTLVAYTKEPEIGKHAVIVRNHGLHWVITALISQII